MLMADRSELVDAMFVDLTADLVRHKENRQLINRASEYMSEGVAAPMAWARAKREHGVPTGTDEYLRLKEYALLLADSSRAAKPGPFARGRTSAGSPPDVPHLTDEESLPRTPIA